MNELGLDLDTRERINKKIYRMGFEARPLLIVLAALLFIAVVLFALLGLIGCGIMFLLVLAFIYLKRFMESEIEKGNRRPIDDLLDAMMKPDSIRDDGVIDMLRAKRESANEQKIKSASTD